jgi:AcrR family transcriptional regulator
MCHILQGGPAVVSSGRVPRNRYGGVSASERVAARRDRLLAAGLGLFGTRGYLRTTIDQVCAEAGLTKRYFYESFRSCEDLLTELVRTLQAEAARCGMAAVEEAAAAGPQVRVRQGIGAVVDYYTGDIRRGRVVFVESAGISDRIEGYRREYVGVFTALLQSYAAELLGEMIPPEHVMRLNAGALVGAGSELVTEYLLGSLTISPAELADYLTGLAFAMLGIRPSQDIEAAALGGNGGRS